MRTRLTLVAAVAASLWLAACGDSPASQPEAQANDPTEVPANVGASDTAFVGYAGSLAVSDTQEPLKLDKVTAPTSETDEPALI